MRTRNFDRLWRWTVTDELDMPNGEKITVTAKKLTKQLKDERDKYAMKRAREMRRALEDTESSEYKEYILPLSTLSPEDLLKLLEGKEEIQLMAKAQREILSPSPSDEQEEIVTLVDRMDAMDQQEETERQVEKERLDWVKFQLAENMIALKDMGRDELLDITTRAMTDNICQQEWWTAYLDACLKLGVFIGNKPFFNDWPTEADDDLKTKLLQLYQDADAAAFDFSS
jgi:hypothetical protein